MISAANKIKCAKEMAAYYAAVDTLRHPHLNSAFPDDPICMLAEEAIFAIKVLTDFATLPAKETPYDADAARYYALQLKQKTSQLRTLLRQRITKKNERSTHVHVGKLVATLLFQEHTPHIKRNRKAFEFVGELIRQFALHGLPRPTKKECRKYFEETLPEPLEDKTWERLLKELNLTDFLPNAQAGRPKRISRQKSSQR